MQMDLDELPMVEIEDVFVDRENALQFLENELKKRKNRVKEYAIRITQAPGTGKTRLLKEFIKKMEKERKAVGIYINSPEIERWVKDSPRKLESELWRVLFFEYVEDPHELIGITPVSAKELAKKYGIEDFRAYINLRDIVEDKPAYDSMLMDFCNLSLLLLDLPLIIVFDEIQATIGVMTDQFQNAKGQGLFRQIIKLVADLIKLPNVLVVLSGTNYKILHFLEDIGSPIKQKTKEYNLKPLAPEYVGEFYDRVFGKPTDEVTEGLRDWLIENSNGVPRTMVWMAETLQEQGGIEWAREIGLEEAISALDEIVYDRVYEDVQNSVNTLMELKNGKELLEWVAYRSLFDRQIPLVETQHFESEEADKKKICTIHDLVHKGIIHIVDGHFEFRNVYFEQALRKALQIENKTLEELLRLFGMKTTELRGFMSWQRTFLGAYLELALAIALYKMSKQLGTIVLSKFLTPKPDSDLKIQVDKIVRIASPELIVEPELNTIYAAPERGPDMTIFTEDKRAIFIECKNWTQPLSYNDFKNIRRKLKSISKKFKNYKPVYIIAVPKIQDIIFDELELYPDTYFLLEDSLKKILGEPVFAMFDEIRKSTLRIRKIL